MIVKKTTKKPYFEPINPNPNFPEIEERLLKKWYEQGIVDKYLHKNDNSDKFFSFLDGPITANNPMGVHHAWGRTYKDLWQRYKNMRGFRQRFQNGFDCFAGNG
ncbi:MAG: Isoleucyl-tRNA synthetase [Candidatus Woesebacteria bacterium GW2011_GWA1_37_8]|uniref:Isoleucyl-tRNA synthetase n=1 Tax=Candidatus Woesebacteria bacterium GW2011_GWA1_37_8 TaxID=1618546 RepID=A0A0G0HNS6_9BACT|nr:MAG: Isoleucyl-tRNA synthetase [Candidatus Woesebacteria bacterium GW2011_GWA1_37_8]